MEHGIRPPRLFRRTPKRLRLQLVSGGPWTADRNSPPSFPPGCSPILLPVSGRNHRQGDRRSDENCQRKGAGRRRTLDSYIPLTHTRLAIKDWPCWKSKYAGEKKPTCANYPEGKTRKVRP